MFEGTMDKFTFNATEFLDKNKETNNTIMVLKGTKTIPTRVLVKINN